MSKAAAVGDRVEITALQEDPHPVPVGMVGTVTYASHFGLTVRWEDRAYQTGLALPEDEQCFRVVG